ncbi:MAG: hypothetical protein J6R18_09555, partial [Kiritimatiellae bacterium]|nr:hypothetical protein [Kiritimatiellia bacterium]
MINKVITKFVVAFAASVSILGMAWAAEATASRPNAEVKVLSPLTLAPNAYMAWPNGEEDVERPLQIVMNFKAKDTLDQAKASGYGKYKCDFYLTFSGLSEGMIIADDCYLAGNYGTFGWIVIPADGLELEEDVEYPVVSAYDANLTYEDICGSVKNFTAAIYVAPDILAANPDFKVQLALKMTNPNDENDVYTVGVPAVYDFASLTQNRDVKVVMPSVDDIKVGGANISYSQKEVVRAVLSDITENSSVVGVETGIFAADNADEVAAAKEALKKDGVDDADAEAAKPELSIKLFDVALNENEVTKFTYYVTPYVSVGDKSVKISEFSSDVKFRLPVPSTETRVAANVYHNDELLGRYDIKSLNGEKYVEVVSKSFSAFAVEPLSAVATIGGKEYYSLEAAVAAAVSNDTIKLAKNVELAETLVISADKKDLTIDLNGMTVSGAEGVKVSNLGELTVKDSSGELNSLFTVPFENDGVAWLNGGLFMGGVVNGESGKIQVIGGGYPSDVNRAWIPAGYASGKVSENGLSGFIVAKLPTATVCPIPDAELMEAPELTFSLKFKADGVSAAQMLCFEKWYADFEFTVSDDVRFNAIDDASDGYLAGSYASWLDGAWVSVPCKDVAIEANKPLRIMAFGNELMSTNGLKQTYKEIVNVVKEFSCGVMLRESFRAVNPGFKVTLALKLYNPENEAECFTVGFGYTFELPSADDSVTVMDVYGNIVNCETLSDAIDAVAGNGEAANGGEVTLIKDTTIPDSLVVIGSRNLFLDTNGKTLTLCEGKKFTVSNVNVAFVGSGTLAGFKAANVELDDASVLTLPASAENLALDFEEAGKYVTKNADNTWSVANKFELQ